MVLVYWMVLVDVSAEDAQEWMSMDTASKQAVTAVCLIPNVTSSVVAVLVLGRARQHPITPLSLYTTQQHKPCTETKLFTVAHSPAFSLILSL